ncbi:MAG: RNA 2',3'-cyclic phosphodiesterase [Nitrospiraceae bacterium]|nr:MAG: RNA 2',3'-cyclic phosphodiesterase [Nitrospiraceae bacterium]
MRSFIAIELPESAKSALAGLQQELKESGADVRWVKPEHIHLTLKFLGDVGSEVIDSLIQVLKGTCREGNPFSIEIRGTGVFPHARSPRVIWAGVSGGAALAALQRDIERGLSALGFDSEERPFVPHLTVGRVRSSLGKRQLIEKVDGFRDALFAEVDVRSVALMKSDLSPAGAHYTALARISLGKGFD